uniref:Uncharacterized protein n=1 Tax=uncultured prokaryote TaxID=198431 RepID=A0A0H5Q339_9ZZZZ|nr:hypothetical protein [uncultured prokaryote]
MSKRTKARELRRSIIDVLHSEHSITMDVLMARNTLITLYALGYINNLEYRRLTRECNNHPAMSAM